MNQGIPIQQLTEASAIPEGSMLLVRMGDGTGTKKVKKEVLFEQMETDMTMGYDDTLAFLDAEEDTEGAGGESGTESNGNNESGVE